MKLFPFARTGQVWLLTVGGLTMGGCDFVSHATATGMGGLVIALSGVSCVIYFVRRTRRLKAELSRARLALKMSEERYRLLLDQAEDAIVVADAQTGLIIEVNRAASLLLDCAERDLVGQRHTILHTSPERDVFRKHFSADATPGEIIATETSVLAKNGTPVPVHMRASIVTTGTRKYFQAILRDLRPRLADAEAVRRSEGRLREVEDRWQLAVRALNVGIFEKNYSTGRTYLSERWKEMIGFSDQSLPNERDEWQARIHPEDRERVVAQLQAHLRKETELYRVEYRMLCQDGNYKCIEACGRAVFNPDGSPQRFIGAHMDISERVAVEASLRENEIRYRKLFEDNPNPMWVYDLETYRMLAVNSAALRHYGYTVDEFLKLTIFDIRPASEIPKFREQIINVPSGTSIPGVWTHARKDGGKMLMRIRSHQHEFAGRKGMLVLAEDVTARHEAEERLRASEQRYRNLFENAAEGVYETTASGQFRSVNPALARMLGYSNPSHMIDVIRSAAYDFYIEPNRRDQFFQVLGAGDAVTGFESEVRRADGTVCWISENARAIRDEYGQIVLLEGFVSDITERKRAEAVIRASEERYRVLFEQSPVAILEHDFRPAAAWLKGLRAEGVTDLAAYLDKHPEELGFGFDRIPLVGANEEAVRLIRAKSRAELMEKLESVLTEDALALRRSAFLAIWEGRQEIETEITIKTFDGSSRRALLRWWLPLLDGEEMEWTQVVLLDLTAIRSAEAELAAERERLRVTLRAMAEALLTTDIGGTVQFMNESAERLTGWAAGAAIGRSVDEVCRLRHEKTKAPVPIPVSRAISEHRVIDFPLQTTLVSRQGLPCMIDGRCAPMHDVAGHAIGGVMVFRDVTERARLEAELLRSSKLEAVGILAGGIAHDFNNILTVVMGNVTLAMLDSVVMEAAGRWLAEAERGVMRARDLTQQLLTFAKGGDPVRKAVQLLEVVREAAEFALHGSKVRCEFFNEPDLWAADVDKGQIGQVVQNLVINAVQAMPEGGVVKISLKNACSDQTSHSPLALGKYVQMTIADTGIGIRADHVARIFDPYFTTKQSGSGLGLATVYSIVRKHQGHIEVESELGRGTKFITWLPAVLDARPVATELPGKIERLTGKVLFMDDEDTIRLLAVTLLSRLGLEVTSVADGAEAVKRYADALATGSPYRLVMMDLTVPGGMGGLEAMQELLKIDPRVRAIVSSGYSSDPVLANYRAHGFRGMVPKPYRFTDLARTIGSVLDEQ